MVARITNGNVVLQNGQTRRLVNVDVSQPHIKIQAYLRQGEQFFATDPEHPSEPINASKKTQIDQNITNKVDLISPKTTVELLLCRGQKTTITYVAYEILSNENVIITTTLGALVSAVTKESTEDE